MPERIGPVRRAFSVVASAPASFLPSAMPMMVRGNYRHEITGALLLPFLLAPVEGTIAGVVVKVAYEPYVPGPVLDFVVALLTAATPLANIVSFVWVRLSHGREKVRFVTALQASVAATALGIAFLPRNELGLVLLAALVVLARLAWAGVVTIRSTIWSHNYPRSHRARITGKFGTLQVVLIGLLGLGLGQAMDRHENAFRVLIPVGVVLGAIGIANWRRVRVRGQAALLKAERSHTRDEAPSYSPLGLWRVLRGDARFSAFMACQFLLGLGNIGATAPLVVVQRDQFELEYLGGIALSNSIPLLVMPAFIPLWARMIDRTHIVHFRAVHSWLFVAALALVWIGSIQNALWMLVVAAFIRGVAFAGGMLGWTLGHLDFAPPDKASQYMSVHVTLTGVRGIIAPFACIWAYQLLEKTAPGTGGWVFAGCLALTIVGAGGFVLMSLVTRRERRLRLSETEIAPPSRAGI